MCVCFILMFELFSQFNVDELDELELGRDRPGQPTSALDLF